MGTTRVAEETTLSLLNAPALKALQGPHQSAVKKIMAARPSSFAFANPNAGSRTQSILPPCSSGAAGAAPRIRARPRAKGSARMAILRRGLFQDYTSARPKRLKLHFTPLLIAASTASQKTSISAGVVQTLGEI